jgi:hypothetical protein
VLSNDQEMLGCLLHAPRVPFIAPRQLGAVGGILGRPKLLYCSCPVPGSLPNRAQPTVADWWQLAQRTLSGAPCRPLEQAMRRSRIWWPTVALTAIGSLDSLVHHRTVR